MRGPRFIGRLIVPIIGITPACAGTTGNLYCDGKTMGDHPRMCGDHRPCRYKVLHILGSPPHVRGPHLKLFYLLQSLGITPACAGTTRNACTPPTLGRDHPRMCGDHPQAYRIFPSILGSPPHVRGPRICTSPIFRGRGITPACAGTTTAGKEVPGYMGDHPRMCGDHAFNLVCPAIISGSPPHVRGPH